MKRYGKLGGEALQRLAVEPWGIAEVLNAEEKEAARAERVQIVDRVDGVVLGLSDDGLRLAERDFVRGVILERVANVIRADVERVKRARNGRRMRPRIGGDLVGQIGSVRLGGIDVGRAGLGPAEGEIVAASEAGLQGPEAELDRQILDPGWPVAGMAVEIRLEGRRLLVLNERVAGVREAIAESKQRRIGRRRTACAGERRR
jgi:hypothetical protein